MSDKEKMREFGSWLIGEIEEIAEGYKEANESGSSTAALVKGVTKIVLLQVLNKFRAIEGREDEKI